MKFVNRENELKALNDEYKKDSSFVVLYGRRRAGKTTLIKEFIADKRALYFFSDTQAEVYQISRFKSQMASFFNDSIIEKIDIKEWDTLFEYFSEKLGNEKIILAIDEFQYLCKENKSFASIFQRIWDNYLIKKNIMVILCGSLLGMMYEHALSYTSPLYGRRTAQIRLKQISVREYKKFYNEISPIDIAQYYSVTGGIPKYIEHFSENRENIFEGIEKNILNKNSFLYSEPRFLLKEEINEVSTYFSILQTIALGEHKIGNIAKRLSIQVNNLTSFITKLIELDIIKKETPVTEENPEKSKKGLYFITDNFLRFWFKFLLPYENFLEIEQTGYVIEKIKEDFNQYVSFVFEDICRELVYTLKLPFQPVKSGRWWNNDTEIDIVTIGDKNEIMLSECKWRNNEVGINILEELIKKSEFLLKSRKYDKIYYSIFSKIGFTKDLINLAKDKGDILLYDVDDLL